MSNPEKSKPKALINRISEWIDEGTQEVQASIGELKGLSESARAVVIRAASPAERLARLTVVRQCLAAVVLQKSEEAEEALRGAAHNARASRTLRQALGLPLTGQEEDIESLLEEGPKRTYPFTLLLRHPALDKVTGESNKSILEDRKNLVAMAEARSPGTITNSRTLLVALKALDQPPGGREISDKEVILEWHPAPDSVPENEVYSAVTFHHPEKVTEFSTQVQSMSRVGTLSAQALGEFAKAMAATVTYSSLDQPQV